MQKNVTYSAHSILDRTARIFGAPFLHVLGHELVICAGGALTSTYIKRKGGEVWNRGTTRALREPVVLALADLVAALDLVSIRVCSDQQRAKVAQRVGGHIPEATLAIVKN